MGLLSGVAGAAGFMRLRRPPPPPPPQASFTRNCSRTTRQAPSSSPEALLAGRAGGGGRRRGFFVASPLDSPLFFPDFLCSTPLPPLLSVRRRAKWLKVRKSPSASARVRPCAPSVLPSFPSSSSGNPPLREIPLPLRNFAVSSWRWPPSAIAANEGVRDAARFRHTRASRKVL